MRLLTPLLALAPSLLVAQSPIYTLVGNHGSGKLFGASVAIVGDVDGDGFGDIAIGSPGDDTNGADAGLVEIRSGRNGSLMRSHYGTSPGAAAGRLVVAMDDVDADGRPDYAFTSPYASGGWPGWVGTVQVISGASGQLIHNVTDGMQGFANHVAAGGDLNGDGHADIIAGGPNGCRIWSGAPGLALLLGSTLSTTIGVKDTNGNGIDEYCAGTQVNELPAVFVSNVAVGFSYFTETRVVRPGDIDRNGRPDICLYSPNWNASGGRWAVGGQGVFSAPTAQPGRAQLVSGGDDYDGDGWPDIAEGLATGFPLPPTNTVRVTSGRTNLVLHTLQLPGTCVALDGPRKIMPGAGSCIVSTWWNGSTETVYVHVGTDTTQVGRGTGSGWSPPRIHSDPLVRGQTAMVNGWRSAPGVGVLGMSLLPQRPVPFHGGDLWLDLGSLALLGAFPLRPTYDQWAADFQTTAGDKHLMADVDGDGRDDMVIWRANGGRWEARLSNGFRMTTPWVLHNHGGPGDVVLAADIDGNGAADAVVVTPATGNWRVAYANASGWAAPTPLVNGYLAGHPEYLLGDVDGNGRADLVAWMDGGVGSWNVGFNTSSGIASPALLAYHGAGSTRRFVGDCNGDGKADAVAFHSSTGTWTVALSIGTAGFYPYTTWKTQHGVNSTSQMLVDVHGDGRKDAVVTHGGDWWVAPASQVGTFLTSELWLSGIGAQATAQLCGDVHGDEAADAVMFYANSGNGFVESAPSLAPDGLPTFMSPGYSSYGFPLAIPSQSNLLGVPLMLQEFYFPSTMPFADITNGVVAVVR